MTFNFGSKPAGTQPATTAAPTFSFGASQAPAAAPAPASGGFSFGSFGAAKPATSPFGQPASSSPFGQPAATGSANPSPFGAPATNPSPFGAPTSSAAAPSMFGQTSAATSQPSTSSPFSFGQTPASAPPATPKPSTGLFAGFGQASGSTTPAGTPAPSTFSFGKPANPVSASTTPAQAPAFSFPSAQPATNAAATSSQPEAPKPAFSFPSAGSTTPAGTPAKPNAFSFGAPPASTSAPATSKPAEAPKLGGFSFGAQTPATTSSAAPSSTPAFSFPAAASSSAAPSSMPTFSLGGAKPAEPAKTTSAPSFSLNPPASTSTPSSTPAFSLGTPASTATPASTSAAAAETPKAAFSFGNLGNPAKKPSPLGSNAPLTTSTLGASTTAPAASGSIAPSTGLAASKSAPVPNQLAGKRLEDIVNNWSAELDERTKDFAQVAAEVKAWDAVLVENGDKIAELFTSLQATEPVQQKITSSLDYVEGQQKEMSLILDSYEKQVNDLLGPGDHPANLYGGPDAERERAYRLADSLNTQLDDMSRSLSSLIQDVNGLSHSAGITMGAGEEGDSDPLVQIAAILNAHLTGLTWIENSSESLRKQVDDLEGRVQSVSNGTWQGFKRRSNAGTPNRGYGGYARR